MTTPHLLSLPEFAAFAQAAALDVPALPGTDAVVAVDLCTPSDGTTLEQVARLAPECGRVVVGVAQQPLDAARREVAAAFDTTPAARADGQVLTPSADPVADAARLRAAGRANPQAALVLAQVLRAGAGASVENGLDVESFAYSTLLGGAEFAAWLAGRGGPRPVPAPVAPPVLAERSGGVLRVTLNRPERRNAYGRDVRDAFTAALRVAVADPSVEQVLVDGAGPSFCAGGDLDEFGSTPDPVVAHFVRTRAGAGAVLARLAGRTQVRVHGHCVGAGIELPAFAGHVSAHPGAVFRLPETAMGLIPGAGGTVSVPRRVGRWRALAFALSGTALTAAQALEWGLVDAVEEAWTPNRR